jgi:hypothetical protein
VSTRCRCEKRAAGGESPQRRSGRALDLAEEVAIVACAKRDLLLRAHRHRLRPEDLEDCYSQATLELVASAQSGGVFANRLHIANTAARYLAASGAPGDYRRAIFAYNHAGWYVADVQSWAARYRGSTLSSATSNQLVAGEGEEAAGPDLRLQAETTTSVRFVAGEQATLSPGDGHLAMIPAGAPTVVQAMIVAGNELQQLPYGPGGHPDPRGALQEDCSSTTNYVLYRAGVRPIAEIVKDNPLAQDYVRWGLPGPGRWVTLYSTTSPSDHTFMTIAGLRLDTSHNGTDVGPNAFEDGPRWRILDRIPTWAHWSVRHPPGL